MPDGVNTEYCSFTKAVEYLGDRWSLLILRELGMQGPLGFNALAASIPGHISRSILTDRLRKLRELGIVARIGDSQQAPYALTEAGRGFMPTMLALNSWADGWIPEDPAFVARDPEVVLGWLAERIVSTDLPQRQAVLELHMHYGEEYRSWLVVEDGTEPYGCLEDPLLDESRYVYVEGGLPVLMAVARGRRSWAESLADGSLQADGDPTLIEQLPRWFKPADLPATPSSDAGVVMPRAAAH